MVEKDLNIHDGPKISVDYKTGFYHQSPLYVHLEIIPSNDFFDRHVYTD